MTGIFTKRRPSSTPGSSMQSTMTASIPLFSDSTIFSKISGSMKVSLGSALSGTRSSNMLTDIMVSDRANPA